MTNVRRTLDLDAETDARLRELAERRGQDASHVISDALALLESTDPDVLDIEEDLRRLREFERTGQGVPLEDVMAWVRSWGTPNELPPPRPRRIE